MPSTDVTKIFQERLEDLMKETGTNGEKIAKETGISKAAISKYVNDNAEIGINNLVKIAKYFNVHADYLLGLSEAKTNNKNLRDICDFVGMSESAVLTLNDCKNGKGYCSDIRFNRFIEDLIHLFLVSKVELLAAYCTDKDRLFRADEQIKEKTDIGQDFSDIITDELAEHYLFFQVSQYKLSHFFNEYLNDKNTIDMLKNLNAYLDYFGVGDE